MRRSLALLFVVLAVLPGGAPAGAGGSSGEAPVAAGSWAWPVAAPHPIVRPFIAPATRYSAGHRGIDVATDDPRVLAPAAGIVHFSGVVVDRPVLSIRHPGGLLSSFEPVDSPLTAGTPVRRGDVIGTLQPGHCSRLCLHFGVRRDGEYVSPLLFLGGIPRSVLLPTRAAAASRRRFASSAPSPAPGTRRTRKRATAPGAVRRAGAPGRSSL